MLWVPNFQHVVTVHQGQSCGEAKKLVDLSPSLFNLLWRKMGEGQRGGEVVMFPRFWSTPILWVSAQSIWQKVSCLQCACSSRLLKMTNTWPTVMVVRDRGGWGSNVSWPTVMVVVVVGSALARDSHLCISCRSICDQNQNGIKETFLRVGQKIKVTSRWNKSRNQYIVRSHSYGFMHSQSLPTITLSGEKLCLIAWLLPFKALDYWCWE